MKTVEYDASSLWARLAADPFAEPGERVEAIKRLLDACYSAGAWKEQLIDQWRQAVGVTPYTKPRAHAVHVKDFHPLTALEQIATDPRVAGKVRLSALMGLDKIKVDAKRE